MTISYEYAHFITRMIFIYEDTKIVYMTQVPIKLQAEWILFLFQKTNLNNYTNILTIRKMLSVYIPTMDFPS